jgi:hypothetical protein
MATSPAQSSLFFYLHMRYIQIPNCAKNASSFGRHNLRPVKSKLGQTAASLPQQTQANNKQHPYAEAPSAHNPHATPYYPLAANQKRAPHAKHGQNKPTLDSRRNA